ERAIPSAHLGGVAGEPPGTAAFSRGLETGMGGRTLSPGVASFPSERQLAITSAEPGVVLGCHGRAAAKAGRGILSGCDVCRPDASSNEGLDDHGSLVARARHWSGGGDVQRGGCTVTEAASCQEPRRT